MARGSSIKAVLHAPGVNWKKVSSLRRDSKVEPPHSVYHHHAVKDPFYILDLGVVVELSKRWTQRLEKVQHLCAVKCNPGPACLGPMAALGSGFNCASHGEIEAVLALGISPDRITYAYPYKAKSHIKYGANVGVILTTIDS
ncbi:putative Ornithine decarboxylase [Cocos nucifera]|uniref:Putative Ornithine decarboxylase n=1 Tax=Cocos nucifera TaxID=13894 RepID=A0A8K0IIR4_COCNU|nr:putative Ornithine decarboxylase [Cocos nucifera]KAG1359466.1 putative Ornithine decarboxylase [Cocos nucifera]